MVSTHKRLSVGVATVMLALGLFTSLAQADPTSPRIAFFGCAAGGQFAKSVPAGQPLYVQSGFSSGTRGLVEAAIPKIKNTFSVSYSAGGSAVFSPVYGALRQNPDGTWTAPFRVDLPALGAGDQMTIHWTYAVSQPYRDLVPPSSDWDPLANFQPPWDGTGLKYQAFVAAGAYDLGTCTVTATATP